MNKLFSDIMFSQAKQVVQRASSVAGLGHNGIIGELREIFLRELLIPMLPSDCIVSSGKVVSAYDETSRQLDVIIADRRVLPPLLMGKHIGLFPVESTVATIEVKSTLTLDELRGSHRSALEVERFHHAPPLGMDGHDPSHRIEHIHPYLFAFATDLSSSGKSELERYIDLVGGDAPALRMICVVGRGLWTYTDSGWTECPFKSEAAEIVAFVASITNKFNMISLTRRQPNMAQYLFDHRAITETAP